MSTPVREYLDGPVAYAPPVHRQAAARLLSPCFVLIDGEQRGPLSSDVVMDLTKRGTITADMLVWREGWEDWRPARSIDWLETLFVERRDPAEQTEEPQAPVNVLDHPVALEPAKADLPPPDQN